MVEHCRATCQPGTRYTATRMSYTAAVVGLGTIAGAHLSAIEDQQRLRLTGVCDIDRDILARRGAETSVPGFHDYRELLQTAPDVVVVALPHHLHCDVAVAALEAGCHVLVEKPLAVSVEQCRTLLQAARRARRILAVSDTAAYHPGALLTGVHFRAGTLGRFLSGMHHNVRFYFHAGRPAWFLDPAASGGGMFANVGLHRLAQTRACLPGLVPCAVSAAVSRLAEHPVEACTSALVRYHAGGAMHYEELGYVTRPSWWPLSTHYLFEEGHGDLRRRPLAPGNASQCRARGISGYRRQPLHPGVPRPATPPRRGGSARPRGLGVRRRRGGGARRIRQRGGGAGNRPHRALLAHRPPPARLHPHPDDLPDPGGNS